MMSAHSLPPRESMALFRACRAQQQYITVRRHLYLLHYMIPQAVTQLFLPYILSNLHLCRNNKARRPAYPKNVLLPAHQHYITLLRHLYLLHYIMPQAVTQLFLPYILSNLHLCRNNKARRPAHPENSLFPSHQHYITLLRHLYLLHYMIPQAVTQLFLPYILSNLNLCRNNKARRPAHPENVLFPAHQHYITLLRHLYLLHYIMPQAVTQLFLPYILSNLNLWLCRDNKARRPAHPENVLFPESRRCILPLRNRRALCS